MTLAELILAVFAASNTLRLFAYVPQLVRIGNDAAGAAAISYWTWGLFAVSHLTTVAYAAVVVDDLTVAVIFTLNALFCIAIVGLTAYKRRRFAGSRGGGAWCLPGGSILSGLRPRRAEPAKA